MSLASHEQVAPEADAHHLVGLQRVLAGPLDEALDAAFGFREVPRPQQQARSPDQRQAACHGIRRFIRFRDIIGRYFAGSLLITFMNGLWLLILGLALGIPLAPFVRGLGHGHQPGPPIGGFLGGSVFVLLGLTQGVGTGLICLGWFVFYQQLENHFLQPAIVGEAVDISPPGTMIAALVGGAALGVPGAMVAIPSSAQSRPSTSRTATRTARSHARDPKGRRLLDKIRRRSKEAP